MLPTSHFPQNFTADKLLMPDGKTSIERYYRCLSNENLLDNAYRMVRDEIINQRGKATYSGTGYTMDRWVNSSSGTVTLLDNGIKLSASVALDQRIEKGFLRAGQVCTASILTSTGLYSHTTTLADNAWGQFSFGDSGLKGRVLTQANAYSVFSVCTPADYVGDEIIFAAFLEIGDHQTFAHKEGDTWVLNALPNPMLELLKCQQYYVRSDLIYAVKNGFTRNQMNCNCHFPVRMRAKPVVKLRSAYYDKPGVLSRFDDMSDTDIPAICNNATLTRDGFGSIATGDTTDSSYTLPNGIYAFKYEASAEL